MEEEGSSWIRRTKFSHTVCHRLDSLNLASAPLAVERGCASSLKSRPQPTTSSQMNCPDKKPVSVSLQIQHNSITNKQRSLSPTPNTALSDAFKEARSDQKRFSTPNPQRKKSEKGLKEEFMRSKPHAAKVSNSMSEFMHSKPHAAKVSNSMSPSNSSPLRHLSSLRAYDKSKRKDSAWTKYFDYGGGKVNAVEMSEEWTLDLSELMIGLRFAHGAHSRLYHGFYKEEPVAVKMVSVPDDDEDGNLAARLEKQFNREVTHLSRLQHENVIKFVAACRNPPVYFVITEYLSEGSLRAYLHKHKSLPLEKLLAMALDIAHGMEYIHSQGIIHRDLKPENILINDEFHLKIADFGIACEEIYCDPLADDPGTYRWMAPEMIKHKSYGRKVDVYSFGLILWEMVTGRIPYEDKNPIQAAFAVVHKNMRPAVPGDCAPAMRALIEQCWSSKADKRPEFWQIVKVLEQFETSLAHCGNLILVQNPDFQDQKKGLLHWIQRLSPVHPNGSPTLEPKLS